MSPYIPAVERIAFDTEITLLASKVDKPGQLAYIVFRLMGMIVRRWGGGFGDYAGVIGAVVLTTLEFIRRVLWPHETAKRALNGDVEF